jgi:hypothetical protein
MHKHRWKANPEEKRFALAWAGVDERNLDYMLSTDQQFPPTASDRDRVVAATVMQWLGSPVGQAWLRDLGYERKDGGDHG